MVAANTRPHQTKVINTMREMKANGELLVTHPKRKTGPPRKATVAEIERICARIAMGEMLIDMFQESDAPEHTVFWQMIEENKELSEKYTEARKKSATHIVEKTITEADRETDPAMAALLRVKADVRRWAAGKFAPDLYADVKRLEVSGEVRHAHALDLTQDQRARIAQEWIMTAENQKSPALIEGTATTTGPDKPPRAGRPGKAGGARRQNPPTDT